MSPQRGRPKSDNPKNHDIKIRFDEKLYERMMIYCGKHGITKTEFVRMVVDSFLRSNK